VEPFAELVAVDAVVGGVEVQDQFFRHALLGPQTNEHIHERVLQAADVRHNLLVTALGIRSDRRQFQSLRSS
jgi:hypothetical protein